MKVTFMGAARTVTGSCYMIEAAGARFAVDCGMHQGNKAIEARNFNTGIYEPGRIDFILLTHAHIDHSGLLPRMVRDGYDKPVYCTPPTQELAGLMLQDSAHIQEIEAEWRSQRYARRDQHDPVEPLYTMEDALKVIPLFKNVKYHEMFEPHPGVQVSFYNAGHILGAAAVHLTITEKGFSTRLLFSGDHGRPGALIVQDPEDPPETDYLFVESTYGDRDHKQKANTLEELAEAIAYSYDHREKVIIPAFAVERTQEVLYCLHALWGQGALPADMPVFVDSPLAIRATEVFRRHQAYFDPNARQLLARGMDPFDLPNLRYTLSAAESQAINEVKGPAVIVSASGMCNAGRIRHHLKHNLWKTGASIVFVGYQGEGTPGRKIVDGGKSISLFGDEVAIKAKVFTIGGFSGHAGQSQLLDWIGAAVRPDLRIVFVHGEAKAQAPLAGCIREKFQLTPIMPDYLEELEIAPGREHVAQVLPAAPEAARPKVDWEYITKDTEAKWAALKAKLGEVHTRPWAEQTELRERMLRLNFELVRFLTTL
ncbi:MAG: MBL fold metallo-hydrolase [Desulfovibrionaceae bacterium]|nr:MBL fold metallo-hydrolase [Desulfovibrionaceae bacterium]